MEEKIDVVNLKDIFIIRNKEQSSFYYTKDNVIYINKHNFFALLKFLLYRGFMSPKVLEGLLSEYYDIRKSY